MLTANNENICTYFVLSFMLSFLGCYHLVIIWCYHFSRSANVIIFMLSFFLYIFCVIIYVIILCSHLLLSFPPFFLFPENVTHSKNPCTSNEGLVRIQYKCLVPIYVFPEMILLFPKKNYNVLSPSSYTHIYVRDLYISKIGLPILLQGNMWTDPGNI